MDAAKPTKIFVDTNVWLDRFIPGRSSGDEAKSFFTRCSQDDIELLYAPQSALDVYQHIKQEAKRWVRAQAGELTEAWAKAINTQAWECVRSMDEVATMAGMNVGELWLAMKYEDISADLEGNLIVAVAKRAGADYLVTSDKELIAKSSLATLAPLDMLAVLKAEA